MCFAIPSVAKEQLQAWVRGKTAREKSCNGLKTAQK